MRNLILLTCVTYLAASAACTRHNPVVCCTSPADCNSIGLSETSRPCEGDFVCTDHKCATPGTTPDAPPGPECVDDTQCTAPLAHCTADQHCAECVRSDQCPAAAPVCDAMACRSCRNDNECASGVCDPGAGLCAAEAAVLYASPSGSVSGNCVQSQPCTFSRAISLLDASHQLVKMSAGNYTGSVSIVGKTAEIHGAGAILNATSGVDTITVEDGAHLKILGLTVINPATANSGTLWCGTTSSSMATPTVELDDATIDSGNIAFDAQPCTATVKRSHIISRTLTTALMFVLGSSSLTAERVVFEGGDGVWADGVASSARITNSVFKNMGSSGAFAGTNIGGNGAGSVFVSFSTIVNSSVICGSGAPRCAGGTATGSCMDNSIVLNGGSGGDSISGSCKVDYSIIALQTTSLGGQGNQLATNPMVKDAASGDYHLTMNSPAIDAADPSATNTTDFDGHSRPQGAHADIGAFEYTP